MIDGKSYKIKNIEGYGDCYIPIMKTYPLGLYGQWFSWGKDLAFLGRVDNCCGGAGSVRLSLFSYPSCNIQNAFLVNMTQEEAHEKVTSHGWVYRPDLTMGPPVLK